MPHKPALREGIKATLVDGMETATPSVGSVFTPAMNSKAILFGYTKVATECTHFDHTSKWQTQATIPVGTRGITCSRH